MKAPSTKVVIPTLTGALATVALAITKHTGDPTTVAIAAATVIEAVLGYLTPHKPVTGQNIKKAVKKVTPSRKKSPSPPAPKYVEVYDATNPAGIGRVASTSLDAVAGYVDGRYKNIQEMEKDYPNHRHVSLAVFFGDKADYADCEKGDFTVPQAIASFERGDVRGIYADDSDWEELNTYFDKRQKRPKKWNANPTGELHITPGFDGTQCIWGSDRDTSLVNNVSFFN